jgi:hypothetical protein
MSSSGISDYEQQWRQYKVMRNCRLVLLLAVFFVPPFLPVAEIAPEVLRIGVAVVVGAFVLTEFWLDTWRCPRCGHWYSTKMISSGLLKSWWVRKCVHCGLPKYSDGRSLEGSSL